MRKRNGELERVRKCDGELEREVEESVRKRDKERWSGESEHKVKTKRE